jgi:hypothetical protein
MLDGRATFLSLPIGKTDFLDVARSRRHASYPSSIVFMLFGLQYSCGIQQSRNTCLYCQFSRQLLNIFITFFILTTCYVCCCSPGQRPVQRDAPWERAASVTLISPWPWPGSLEPSSIRWAEVNLLATIFANFKLARFIFLNHISTFVLTVNFVYWTTVEDIYIRVQWFWQNLWKLPCFIRFELAKDFKDLFRKDIVLLLKRYLRKLVWKVSLLRSDFFSWNSLYLVQ